MQEREETKIKGREPRANLPDNKPEESGGITVAKQFLGGSDFSHISFRAR
jgi:hypothetical protein